MTPRSLESIFILRSAIPGSKVYEWVYPKEDLYEKKTAHSKPPRFSLESLGDVDPSHVPIRCTVEQGYRQTKLTWKGRFISLLVKQTKVSQEDPRYVFFFRLTRLELLHSCLWHFLLFSTDSTNMFLRSVPFPPTSLQCSRGVFFPRNSATVHSRRFARRVQLFSSGACSTQQNTLLPLHSSLSLRLALAVRSR